MAAIFDLDGTLVIKGVQPNAKVIGVCNNTPDAYIITGRPESERAATVNLLRKYGIRYKALYMNRVGQDLQGQLRSKRVNAQRVLAAGPVTMAIDDNAMARTLYKRLGISNVSGP